VSGDGSLYKRCKCRDADGKEAGASCPDLKSGNAWNSKHGTWYYALELKRGPGNKRRPRLRAGGYPTKEAATQARDKAKKMAERGGDPSKRTTVDEFLTKWISRQVNLKPAPRRTYQITINTYLIPLLGHIALRDLTSDDIDEAFDAIRRWNTELAKGHPVRKYQRHVGPAAMQRIRSVLRKALNYAEDQGMIGFNPASRNRVHLEAEEARKPVPWTPARVKRFESEYRTALAQSPITRGNKAFLVWRSMKLRPNPVMIWMPEDTGRFLEAAQASGMYAPLHPVFHLIACTGMRRGEACGLLWEDLHLDPGEVEIRRARVQSGWQVSEVTPKSQKSVRRNLLDAETVTVLKAWRSQQAEWRLKLGKDWADKTGLVFTKADGTPWHPAAVTMAFESIAFNIGLPPVKLHALRHGWASYAVASGVPMKAIQEQLGHSTSKLTQDTYTAVLEPIAREAAEKVAGIISRGGRQ
jgi:integrase